MKRKGKLIIVPNEEKLDAAVFERVLNDDKERHLKYIKEFVKINNLDYQYTNYDDNIAPADMALEGHLVIKTDFDFMLMAILYIPKKHYRFSEKLVR